MIISYLFFIFSVVSIFIVDKLQYRRPWYDPLYSYLVVITLYVSPLSIRYILNMRISGNVTYMFYDIAPIFPYALIICALANFIFYIFYSRSRPQATFGSIFSIIKRIENKNPNYFSAGIFLFFLGLSFFLGMAYQNGGILDFVLLGYGVTSFFSKNPLLATSIPIMYVSAFFFLFSFSRKKRIISFLISISIILILDIMEIVLARRAELAVWNLAYLINFSIIKYKIKLYIVAPTIIIGFVFLNFLGIVRQSNYTNLDSIVKNAEIAQSTDKDYYAYTYTLTEGQFAVPFETLPVLMKYLDVNDFRYGETILASISQWIPRILWPNKGYGVTAWYFRKFYDPSAPPNEGRAFFFLSEGYLNFGIIGILIWSALWGWFWKTISAFRTIGHDDSNVSVIGSFIFSFYTASMIKLVAADSSGIFVAAAKDSIIWLAVGILVASFFHKLWKTN